MNIMDMSISSLIWSTVGFMVFLNQLVITRGASISACFSSQQPLQINCGTGYMLRIKHSFYGHSASSSCSYQPGDCTQTAHQAYTCIGNNYCSIPLPNGNFGNKIPSCGENSTYFQVEYECEPVIQAIDICRTSLIEQQKGFIVTPKYPNNYENDLNCLTTIQVDSSQKINLTIIDMDIEINGTYDCFDWMYAFNQNRSVTLCGKRSNEQLSFLHSNVISIRFKTNNRNTRKGFWMYFEAYPPISTTTASQTTKPVTSSIVTRPPTQGVTTWSHDSDSPNRRTSTDKAPTVTKEKLPFVAIVAGVIGTLTLILIVLLVLLGIKWWNEKKQTAYKRNANDPEYLDARNPAFRSSTGTEFQGVEIYYNC